MTDRAYYELWAPLHMRWVEWVRPVAFIGLGAMARDISHLNFTIPTLPYVDVYDKNSAFIVDLPGQEGVLEGLALARFGYRPIPLYNGTNAQPGVRSLVDNRSIQLALAWGAAPLQTLDIAAVAAPAFLLDTNRLFRYKMEAAIFDNSWDIYDQDLPSPEYFVSQGIRQIVVRSDKVHRDLARMLYKFQQRGLTILFTNGISLAAKITIKKPPRKDKFH